MCGYTIFYQTGNNELQSIEQHQVKIKSEVADQVLIHISDINNEIANSTVSCFADDTRNLLEIKYEKDSQMLQNYWERLHELKLYSLRRRPERYIIIYIWKITQHMVANIDGTMGHKIKTRKHPRNGTQCVIKYPTNRNPAQSL